MLFDPVPPPLSEFDRSVYAHVIPPDFYLTKVLRTVPWDDFHDMLATYYCKDQGRPAIQPVLMLKLEYLRYHHNLSDREVMSRAVTDMGFRFFLQIPVRWPLPDPSLLCIFRGRLGVQGFRRVFDQVVHVAREHGVVKDRLRIKDATHVIANIATPTALALVAQTRDKLLEAARVFAPDLVEGERVNLSMLRENTKGLKPADRLASRVAHLREVLFWADKVDQPENPKNNRAWQTFLVQRDLAHKIFEEREHPNAGDRTISTTDTDARRGRHGEWYEGYMVDIMMDPDSEFITSINVLPASGDEAADTVQLLRHENAAHGNKVEAVSIDGVGFNGPLLRELEDPDGLNIDTYVPVPKESKSGLFRPQDFEEDADGKVVTCPAKQTSKTRYHDRQKQTTKYRFAAEVCRTCLLLAQCMENAPARYGRTVCKTDYQPEHDRARQKATTPQYAAVRTEHPAVERKLGEMMNRHGGRHARYRGRWKVLIQELMVATATNVKRLVRLECAQCCAE